MSTSASWFSRSTGTTADVRLFYFPFAGGNAAAILPWQAELGGSIELQVAQLPGRGTRRLEAPICDWTELVTRLTGAVIELAERPFAFYGHSLGALMAFEVTRELRRRGLPGPRCLWASGAEGPQTRSIKQWMCDLPDDELIAALHHYGGTPAELLADRELMDLLLPALRADFGLSEHYRYRAEASLELPIRIVRGDADPHVEGHRAAGWALETTVPVTEHVYPGDHFFIYPHRAAIARLVVEELVG